MSKKQDLVHVIATRAQSIDYWAIGHYLPNPDPVLKKMGRDISAYREVLADAHVGGCVRRRKAAVKGLEYRLTPTGNEKIDNILTAVFETLPLSSIITQILDATLFGYQVLEVMWSNQNGLWLPVDIQGKPQEWFVFDENNQLKLRNKTNLVEGVDIPDYKFLLATQDASYTNPYGQGDLARCFWAATFKKGGFKFWLEFMEKYGSPWVVGKHPRSNSAQDVNDLLDSLEQMLGTAVAAIPDDSTIDLKESASKGASSQVFDEFLRYCKAEIAIAILGQNQTTESEANRASATAGLEVTKDIRNDDVALVESCLNQLLNWICELNFHVDSLPKFELYEQESIDKLQAERDEILARVGVKFTPQYLNRTYNFEDGDIEVGEPVQAKALPSAQFAETHAPHLAETIVEQLSNEGEPLVDKWLEDVRDRLSQAESLEDFRHQLDSLIPELSFSEYAKVLSLASQTAFLAGNYAVQSERKK